jgi:hypothetical protein
MGRILLGTGRIILDEICKAEVIAIADIHVVSLHQVVSNALTLGEKLKPNSNS